MDKTLLEWKQLKDHSAKLIEKLKQPSEQTAQMLLLTSGNRFRRTAQMNSSNLY